MNNVSRDGGVYYALSALAAYFAGYAGIRHRASLKDQSAKIVPPHRFNHQFHVFSRAKARPERDRNGCHAPMRAKIALREDRVNHGGRPYLPYSFTGGVYKQGDCSRLPTTLKLIDV